MKTVKGDYGKVNSRKGTAVAIGNFDGVHKGHIAILDCLCTLSNEKNLTSVVYTFSEHPINLLKGKNVIKAITDTCEKEKIFEKQGTDTLFLEDFSAVKDLEAEIFVKDILVERLNMKLAVVGENNRFGKNSRGDVSLLKKLGEKYGFETKVVSPVYLDDFMCSSTIVRKALENGDIKLANNILGRNYKIKGEVIGGKKLGRTYGFPTANIVLDNKKVMPLYAVYATSVIFDGKTYKAITNVGKTSFDEKEISRIESFLLDFDGDLYGKEIEIEFIEKMRDFIPFSDVSELEKQLMADKEKRILIGEK